MARGKMSEEQKKAQSEKMKAYWAKKRAEKATEEKMDKIEVKSDSKGTLWKYGVEWAKYIFMNLEDPNGPEGNITGRWNKLNDDGKATSYFQFNAINNEENWFPIDWVKKMEKDAFTHGGPKKRNIVEAEVEDYEVVTTFNDGFMDNSKTQAERKAHLTPRFKFRRVS